MKPSVQLKTFEKGDSSLACQLFDLASCRYAEGDALPPLEQASYQRQHGLRCTGPPTIAQQMDNGQSWHPNAHSPADGLSALPTIFLVRSSRLNLFVACNKGTGRLDACGVVQFYGL